MCGDGGVLAFACTVPLAVYGAVPQGNFRRAGKYPKAGACEAGQNAAGGCAGQRLRRTEKHPRRAGGQHRTDAGARHSGDEQQCRSRLGNLDLSLCHRLAYGACFTHYFSARYGVLYADDGRIREELRPNRCGHQHPERYSGGIHRRHRGHQGVRKSKKQL